MSSKVAQPLLNAWLLTLTLSVGLGGFLLALFPHSPPVRLLITRPIDLAFWPSPPPGEILRYGEWVYAVLGSSIGGWGILMAFVAAGPFRRREMWARNAMTISLIGWFLVDTFLSLRFGVTYNAWLNVVLFALLIIPIALTWRDFGNTAHD